MSTPITFISGWGTTSGAWAGVLNELPKFKHSFISWSDFLSADQTSLSPNSILIGWSLGSLAALKLAIDNLSNIQKLILLSPTARMLKEKNYSGVRASILKSMIKNLSTNRETVLHEFAQNASGGDAQFTQSFTSQAASFSTEELSRGLDHLKSTDLREEIKSIKIPTLILHGTNDNIIPLSQGEYLANNIAGAKIKTFNGTHSLPHSHPEELAREITKFLCS